MMEAGRREQINWGDGNWVFLDVGFSERKRSSGILIGGEKSEPLRFADATRKIVEHVKCAASLTNLVIEPRSPFASTKMTTRLGERSKNS
jgi:hypothetical protein